MDHSMCVPAGVGILLFFPLKCQEYCLPPQCGVYLHHQNQKLLLMHLRKFSLKEKEGEKLCGITFWNELMN